MRLRKSWEYLAVKKRGTRFKDKSFWFQIIFKQDSTDPPKLGVIASRRYGGAIDRNRHHAKKPVSPTASIREDIIAPEWVVSELYQINY